MRIIHTSDWHLGRSIETSKRYEEFTAFLEWLNQTIRSKNADALIVAGDVFDNIAPPNRAQELYYRFLAGLVGSCCRHVVVVAGNHDSPSFLDAPKEVLKALNVHVVGTMPEDPADEVIVLESTDGSPMALVCAVPYLRDRDIRTVEAGEAIDQKAEKLRQGMKDHYARVCDLANAARQKYGALPLIATGHLFTLGGQVIEDDGVKELYVGSLAHASADMFPAEIDYLALGHLHVPQKVGGKNHFRYAGSPIAMGFGEAGQQKQVLLVEFSGRNTQVEEIAVPCFQEMKRVSGTYDEISSQLRALVKASSNAWVEVDYTGAEILPALQEDVLRMVESSRLNVVRVKNQSLVRSFVEGGVPDVAAEDINEQNVFQRFLEMNNVPEENWQEVKAAYNEILTLIAEEDTHRE